MPSLRLPICVIVPWAVLLYGQCSKLRYCFFSLRHTDLDRVPLYMSSFIISPSPLKLVHDPLRGIIGYPGKVV